MVTPVVPPQAAWFDPKLPLLNLREAGADGFWLPHGLSHLKPLFMPDQAVSKNHMG